MPFNYNQNNLSYMPIAQGTLESASKSPFEIAGKAMSGLEDALDNRLFNRDIQGVNSLEALNSMRVPQTKEAMAQFAQKQGVFSALEQKAQQDRLFDLQRTKSEQDAGLYPYQLDRAIAEAGLATNKSNMFNDALLRTNQARPTIGAREVTRQDLTTLGIAPKEFNPYTSSSASRDQYTAGDIIKQQDGSYKRIWVNKYNPNDTKLVNSSEAEYNASASKGKRTTETYTTLTKDEALKRNLDSSKIWQVGNESNKVSEVGDSQSVIKQAQEKREKSVKDDASSVLKNVKAMQAMLSNGTAGKTGVSGGLMSALGAIGVQSDRTALEGYLTNIEANLSFGELQKMRDNSPTGGALGQVTEKELDLLKASVASIDFNAPDWKIKESLDDVEYKYTKAVHGENVANRMREEKRLGKSNSNRSDSNSTKPSAKEIGF